MLRVEHRAHPVKPGKSGHTLAATRHTLARTGASKDRLDSDDRQLTQGSRFPAGCRTRAVVQSTTLYTPAVPTTVPADVLPATAAPPTRVEPRRNYGEAKTHRSPSIRVEQTLDESVFTHPVCPTWPTFPRQSRGRAPKWLAPRGYPLKFPVCTPTIPRKRRGRMEGKVPSAIRRVAQSATSPHPEKENTSEGGSLPQHSA